MEIEEEILNKAKNLGAKYIIEIEEDEKVLFLKEPTKVMYKAWFALRDTDVIAANETLIRSLVIPEVSDMEILEDIKSLGSAFSQLGDIMALKKSTLVTL